MPKADVIVVGAGVVGLSTAKHCAALGATVTVVDASVPGGLSSRAAAGVAIPSFRLLDDPLMLELTSAASKVLAEELASLGDASAQRGQGILRLTPDAQARETMEAKAANQPGWLGRWVSAEELVALEPALKGGQLHGAFLHDEGHLVDTEVYLNGLLVQCERAGVALRLGERVLGAEEGPSKVVVTLSGGELSADQLVVAAGAWAGGLPGLQKLPVKPVRGQMMTVSHPTARLSRVVSGPSYLAPWRGGEIVVGATEEDAGFQNHVTPAGILHLSAVVARLAPVLRESRFVRAWAGLRSSVPGGRPMIGPYPKARRTVIGTGHGGQGILTGALTGRELAAWVVTGKSTLPAEFLPDRILAAAAS